VNLICLGRREIGLEIIPDAWNMISLSASLWMRDEF